MIVGTICLVVGVVALIAFPFALLRAKSITTPLIAMVLAIGGIAVGLSTYDCSPSSPWSQSLGACVGGVPWP